MSCLPCSRVNLAGESIDGFICSGAPTSDALSSAANATISKKCQFVNEIYPNQYFLLFRGATVIYTTIAIVILGIMIMAYRAVGSNNANMASLKLQVAGNSVLMLASVEKAFAMYLGR